MKADIRIAWILARGSERREWWKASLTLIGALLATGSALAAVTVAAVSGQVSLPYAHGLLDRPGERAGVVFTLVLLLVPVLGFLGQCARIGAVHRYRRMAGLRLAGASPGQVRRIAAAESAIACLVSSSAGLALFLGLLALTGHTPRPVAWAGLVAVVVAVPVAAALVSALALRHVVASPLEYARRTVPSAGRRAALGFLIAATSIALSALLLLFPVGRRVTPPVLLVLALVLLTGSRRDLGGGRVVRVHRPHAHPPGEATGGTHRGEAGSRTTRGPPRAPTPPCSSSPSSPWASSGCARSCSTRSRTPPAR